MYEYEIISIPIKEKREGLFLDEDYRHHIAKKAKEGWRFVQANNLSNLAREQRRVDLIFEKKK